MKKRPVGGYIMLQKTNITAHSGCEGSPRDSLESLGFAIQLNTDAIEMDVRMDTRGELRISHNSVSQEEYDSKPTLQQVFDIMKGTGIMINLDMKESFCIRPALDLAKENGFGRDLMIISGILSPEQLAKDPGLKDKAQIYLNLEEILKYYAIPMCKGAFSDLMNHTWSTLRGLEESSDTFLDDALDLAKELQPDVVNTPVVFLNECTLKVFENHDTPLSVWTPSTEEICRQVFSCGYPKLVNLTSKMPSIAQKVRKETLGY